MPYVASLGLLLGGVLHFHQPVYARWVWLATLIVATAYAKWSLYARI